jgi:hypothetical protein
MFADASDYAVGVALTQLHDNDDKHYPVAFASCKFTDVQSRWATIQKESYAIVYGLRRFEHLLWGAEIIVYSDHDPLSYLTTVAPQSAKLIRWALALAKFNLVIKHIPGSLNSIADFLSRA